MAELCTYFLSKVILHQVQCMLPLFPFLSVQPVCPLDVTSFLRSSLGCEQLSSVDPLLRGELQNRPLEQDFVKSPSCYLSGALHCCKQLYYDYLHFERGKTLSKIRIYPILLSWLCWDKKYEIQPRNNTMLQMIPSVGISWYCTCIISMRILLSGRLWQSLLAAYNNTWGD